ncbi:MAG: glycerate kinase [Actinomycetota bacterium]|nr:glycerate kinase [Actinomycetota bacterium]
MPRVVAAPDKFRGTATAREIAAAVAAAAADAGWDCDQMPVSDGGEGFCEALGGRRRTEWVHGPLGGAVLAEWRLLADDTTAVVEMAAASGLVLVGGSEGNDPVRADTRGTGELIAAAVKAGARHVLVGVGGSASTDGGLAALDVLEPHSRLKGVEVIVACDVTTRFADAAPVFSPQKGASPAQARLLRRRLERLVGVYAERFGTDVSDLPGSGAAGGLAGGLAAIGATLSPGFEVVAEAIDLGAFVENADLVVTGEGFLDEQSFNGKAVGGVAQLAAESGVEVMVVAGDAEGDQPVAYCSLTERFGREAAMADTQRLVRQVVTDELRRRGGT